MIHRFKTHIVEAGLAAGWFIVGLSWLLDPKYTSAHSPLGDAVAVWAPIWTAGELIGGPLVLYSIAVSSTRLRVAGLWILAGAVAVHGSAGFAADHFDIRTLIYFIHAGAMATRGLYCYRKVAP